VRILLGDYLYAHGLVRIASLGDVTVVHDLAELLSICTQLRAERTPGDGAGWAATVALLGATGDGLERVRSALRDAGDPTPALALAREAAGEGATERALALHAERVD
jgi:hypothetical protein